MIHAEVSLLRLSKTPRETGDGRLFVGKSCTLCMNYSYFDFLCMHSHEAIVCINLTT